VATPPGATASEQRGGAMTARPVVANPVQLTFN